MSSALGVFIAVTCVVAALLVARHVKVSQQLARLHTERASAVQAVDAAARFQSFIQHSADVLLVIGAESTIQYASPSMTRVFGYPTETISGTPFLEVVHPDDWDEVRQALATVLAHPDGSITFRHRVRRRDLEWRYVESVATNLTADPAVGGVVLTARDITVRQELEARLTHQAFYDPLTGLANSTLFRNRVEHAIAREGRRPDGVAVLFLDLDEFKTVNDSLGHREGDRLLVKFAERLLNATRGADTVARLGGDEFAILIENVSSEADTTIVAERVIRSLARPVPLEGGEVGIRTSIGIARVRPGDGAEELLRNADIAMYKAKTNGKGSYEIFAPEMHKAVRDRKQLETDMRHALESLNAEQSQFRIVYQPIVEMHTRRIVGLESLVRWDHPTRGVLPPAVFIPLAEATGQIVELGRWVLARALEQGASWERAWQSQGVRSVADPDMPFSIAVNISGRQLQDDDLMTDIQAALTSSGITPRCVVLEITESVIMQDTESTLRRLHALKSLGIRLAIDDFGTGYSSLSYLQRFPVDLLKMDRGFVSGIARGGHDLSLARTIIALGEMLSVCCIAEGVEDEEQWEHLRALGCGFGQGYFFAEALSASEADGLVRGENPSLIRIVAH